MRIFFQNGSIPTRAAKRLKEQLGIKESDARRATAQVLGYRNWADLERTVNTQPASPLDEECDGDLFRQRRQYQAQQLQSSGIDLPGQPPEEVIAKWQPSAARPQAPAAPREPEATSTSHTGEFLRALIILQKFPEAPVEPHAAVLLEGIRQGATPTSLKLAGIIASELLDGTRKRAPELARQMLEALTEKGEPHSTFNLTTSLMLGDGGPKDEKRAVDLLENLVTSRTTPENVRAMAQSRLGGVYAGGMQRGTNTMKALQLWERAAEAGDAEAGFNAGLSHADGRGVPENLDRAAYFYRLAADNGHVYASTNLGLLLFTRPDLSTSFEEAELRLKFSAEQGDGAAVAALREFKRHVSKVMRDFDTGQISANQFRGVQETLSNLAKGKNMGEVFKDRAPPPKTAPDRQRSPKRK